MLAWWKTAIRHWRLTEPKAPPASPPKWVAPVGARDRAQQRQLT